MRMIRVCQLLRFSKLISIFTNSIFAIVLSNDSPKKTESGKEICITDIDTCLDVDISPTSTTSSFREESSNSFGRRDFDSKKAFRNSYRSPFVHSSVGCSKSICFLDFCWQKSVAPWCVLFVDIQQKLRCLAKKNVGHKQVLSSPTRLENVRSLRKSCTTLYRGAKEVCILDSSWLCELRKNIGTYRVVQKFVESLTFFNFWFNLGLTVLNWV
jgi:hypothetical protein